ncbi:non-specific serine/threonine protein kinase [Ranunculus cassubicifolius]
MEANDDEIGLSSSLLPPLSSVIVAVSKDKNSKYAVKWCLDNFIREQRILFKLLHVHPEIKTVPTPMGNYPISQVRNDIAAAYKKEVQWKIDKMLLPYKKMFAEKKVEVEILVIEADDVAQAISREVLKSENNKLVIGASSRSRFKWKLESQYLSSRISECTPSFCTVYVINKGKLLSVRSSDSESEGSTKRSSRSIFSNRSSRLLGSTDNTSTSSDSHSPPPSVNIQPSQDFSHIKQGRFTSRPKSLDISRNRSESLFSTNSDIRSSVTSISSMGSLQMDLCSLESGRKPSTSDAPTHSSSDSKVDINFALEKLRIELRHARGMYAVAQNETINASQELDNLSKSRTEEALKLQEMSKREEQARESAREEKERHEATKREAEFLREWADREASERREAEIKAAREVTEKEMFEKVLERPFEPYKKFKWEEIVTATSSFSEDLRIGKGAYGTVYKCTLDHVKAAVKVLHSKEGPRTKEFQQELDILSKIRHPHLLLLLGACPDHSCLVYEYMENGSLEDKLLRNHSSPPIPWFKRYRIAWEIATALVFLHKSKPTAIVHRDLKPGNILLDQNLVSKIGDVGLSTLLPSMDSSRSRVYKESSLTGTLCYIDPEYQRTGLISPKSDVYAFGMVILQLLTGKPALALAHSVETALESGSLLEILDPKAGSWPNKESHELAVLGLKCVEIKQIDRPDLDAEVIPVLERLKEIGDEASDSAPFTAPAPPKHFICPLLKKVMEDPCVAADGYTYDRKAIEAWLKDKGTSPVTSHPLRSNYLISNHSLLLAIREWESEK